MTPGRRLVVLAITALVLAGGGVALASGAGRRGVYGTAAANRAAGERQASALLRALSLPAAAHPASGDPTTGGLLGQPVLDEATANLVDADTFATVPASPDSVLRYVATHLPAGASRDGTSGGSDGVSGVAWSLPATGAVDQRILGVQVVALASGTTAVRLDGEAVWLSPRPRWERVPASATSLTISGRGADYENRPTPRSATLGFSRPAGMHRIARYLNGLQTVQPGVEPCPADFGETTTVRFYDAGHRLVGRAVDHPTGCASVALTIGGRTGPSLRDGGGPEAADSVTDALADVGAIPRCRGPQLAFSASLSGRTVTVTGVNRSHTICALEGAPAVVLQTAGGREIALPVRHPRRPDARTPAIAYPDTQAAFGIATRRCRGPVATGARITLPGRAGSASVDLRTLSTPLRACRRGTTVSGFGTLL